MTWYYHGLEFKEEDGIGYVGFVYIIENLIDGRAYVGQKKLKATKRVAVKNKKNKKVIKASSDWQNYWGSNEELKADVKKLGKENFRRTILHLAKFKSIMNWLELKEQVDRNVLFFPEKYYNSFCGGRISRRQVLGKLEIV